jgi:hypothetical protein
LVLELEDSPVIDNVISSKPASNQSTLRADFNIDKISIITIFGPQKLRNAGRNKNVTLDISRLQVRTSFIKAKINGLDLMERFVKKYPF